MNKNKTEACDRFRSKTFDYLSGHQKAFSGFKYMIGRRFTQCKTCSSDYMRASIDGYCQRCLQQVEFIMRERPDVLAALANGGGHRR